MFAITAASVDAIAWPLVLADKECHLTGQMRRSLGDVRRKILPTKGDRCPGEKGRRSNRPHTAVWHRSRQQQALLGLFVVLLLNLNSVCAYADSELEQLSSQTNGVPPSTDSGTSSSSSSSSGTAVVTLRSNLSCYVCMTVDDMRCKFINETNKHIYQLDEELATSRTPTDQQMAGHDEIKAILSSYGGIHGGDRSLMTASSEMLDPDSSGGASGEYSSATPADQAHHIFGAECLPDEHYCSVFRMGVSPVNPQSQEFNFFALIRTCSKACNPGCFIIGNGERTKLSFCITCCTTNYCNYGNAADSRRSPPRTLALTAISSVITVLSVIATFGRL